VITDPNIVVATDQLPLDPEGLIKSPPVFFYPPPEISDLRKKFDRSRDMSAEARLKSQKDRDYFDGPKQLDSEIRTILKMRGQPPIYTNQIRPAINGILGVMQGSKTDPRAFPRNPNDTDASDVASKTLRFIADVSEFDEIKLDCAENYWIEGTCAAIIECDGDNITADQIRWEEFFADPRSRRWDFADATYMGFAQWLNTEFVSEAYPERYAAMGDPMESGGIGIEPTWEDKPENMSPWVSSKDRRLLVVTLFYLREGQWYRCVYCAAGVFEHDLTGYLDGKGANICPIEAVSYAVDRDNNRYGHVRDMLPIQDEVNASRSRSLHLGNSRQIQQTDLNAPPVDADTARREAARADGVIPAGWQLVSTNDMTQANLIRNQEAKSELQRMAPTPAVLGRDAGASSGRERLVLQQAGMTELARPMGRIDNWEVRCYRQMWLRAQQFWTAPKWVRVTDDPKAPKFLQINEPVVDEEGNPVFETDANGAPVLEPVIDPTTGQPAVDPTTGQMMGQPVQKIANRIAELDMDIIIQTTPDTANLQEEVFADLTALVQSGLSVFDPQFEIMVELSPMQDKTRVLEMIKSARDQQGPQIPPEVQQAIEEMQAELASFKEGQAAADMAKTASETRENEAQAAEIEARTAKTLLEPFRQPAPSQSGLNGSGYSDTLRE